VRHRGGVRGQPTIEDAYRKWADDLTRYATALVGPGDAADLVADAFVSMLARGDRAWDEIREPRGYLYRAVLNAAQMSARSGRRRNERELRWSTEPIIGELLIDPSVRRALDRLSVQQRAVTYLTYWHDLTPEAVAELLEISHGSVKRQLARSRSTLRKVL
jgi:RNA polymerase sigma factor (sigma-70 family)